jgi:CDK inhibitor PHO81
MLPFQEDTRLVSFQIDNLDSFTLDFDVFPSYGAKIIAKTVALPNTFRALLSSSGSCCLPLFDPRLRAIGQISFHTQVIKPFQGKPLEITDFETYWKATSQFDTHPSTFVTGSSLSGDFVRLYIQHTSDGIPVLWPIWTLDCGGISVPVARLTFEQFSVVTSQSPSRDELSSLPSRSPEDIADVHRILATAGITLQDALSLLPPRMHVNIHIIYPTIEEERAYGLSPSGDINRVIDATLTVVFDHARAQRAQSPDTVRSVVFSSYNPGLCTAVNWKQPNFPVFLCNDLGREDNAMSPPNVIHCSGRRTSSIKEVVRTAQSNNFMGLICCSRLFVSSSTATPFHLPVLSNSPCRTWFLLWWTRSSLMVWPW